MSNIEKHQPQSMQINTLDEAMRYAQALSGAGMIPDKFKGNPANVLVAQEIAQTLSESTWVVMSELAFIGNTPAFSAKFFRSRVRQAGHKLREYFDEDTMTATAVVIRSDDPDHEHTAKWDMEKAKKHGLGSKNHWLKNPALMLKNRAVSEVVREACYEVMGGVAYTPDEVQDFVREDARRMDQPAPAPQQAQGGASAADRLTNALGAKQVPAIPIEEWMDKIAGAETMDELMELYTIASADPAWESDIKPMFSTRKTQLQNPAPEVVGEVHEAEVVVEPSPA